MKCTEKDQENCQYEKLGCEGCYFYEDIKKYKNLKDTSEIEFQINNLKDLLKDGYEVSGAISILQELLESE